MLGDAAIGAAPAIGSKPNSNDAPIASPENLVSSRYEISLVTFLLSATWKCRNASKCSIASRLAMRSAGSC